MISFKFSKVFFRLKKLLIFLNIEGLDVKPNAQLEFPVRKSTHA